MQSSESKASKVPFDEAWQFIVKVGLAAHRYGSTAGRLETFLVGLSMVVANLWARKTGRPSSIVLIPAIVLLVSGSIGFRGLASMAGGDLLLGAQQFLQMFVVTMTIFVGIVVGYTLIRPESGL
jgi:uncharacterized membrane protein YjjB (DUF3815 family)